MRQTKAGPATAVLRTLYVCAVAGAVIPYGAVEPQVAAAVALGLSVLSVTCALRPLRPDLVGPIVLCIALVSVMSLWAFIQTVPIGIQHPSWTEASVILGSMQGTISVAPYVTLVSLHAILTPVLTFVVGVSLFQDDASAERLARAMAFLALVGAVLGLYEFAVTPDRLLFTERFTAMDGVTAYFVNRNNAATFLGIGAMYWLAFLARRVSELGIGGVADVLFRGDDRRRNQVLSLVATLLAFLTIIVALFLTKSRAGVTASLIGLAIAVLATYRVPVGKESSTSQIFAPAASALILVLGLTYLYGAQYLSRFQHSDAGNDGRWCFFEGMIAAIRERPLTGTGFGTLQYAFPSYRDASCMDLDLTLDRGHSGYLEIAMGMGLPGLAAMITGAFCLGWILLRGARLRRSRRFIPAAALGALVLTILHSSVDFPMQITGLAVYTAAIFATGVVQSRPQGRR